MCREQLLSTTQRPVPARTTPSISSTASSISLPRRDDIHKILVLGSGPIVIGQAAEFDYSGVQACKVLLEEGYEVVLVNSNPATIMTDPEFATRTYIEPLLPGPQRLDVGARGELRVGHDHRRVRVDEHDLVALLEQHLACLDARVVELG